MCTATTEHFKCVVETPMPRSSVLLNASSSRESFPHVLLLRAHFGKDVAHRADEHVDELVEKRLVKTERAAVAHGASQNSAQDVAAIVLPG